MKKFFKPLVLVMLAASMAIVSCAPNRDEIDGIKNDIAALKDKVAANEVDVKAQIGTLQYLLQSYKDEVNPKLVALDAQLKKDYADLSAADAALDKAIKDAQTVLQAAIAKNADDIAANKKEIQAAIAEYKKLVANAIEGFELAMAKAKEDQALVDGAQNMAIDALSAQFKTFKEAVDEAISNLGIKVDELATAMVEMGDVINDLQQQVKDNLAASLAYTDALEASVKATLGVLEGRIIANEAAIKKLNEETIPGIEKAIEALQASIVGLEGNVAALEEKKLDKEVFAAFLKEHTEWKATIDNSIKSINGSIELLKIYDGIIGGQVEYLTELVKKLNGDETVEGSIQQQIKVAIAAVYEKITKDLNTLKTDIEGKIETLQTDIKSLESSLEDANAEIAIINGDLEKTKKDLEAINAKIAAAQGDIKDLQAAKTKLENDLKALEAALESRMKAVEELTAGLKKQIDTINGDKETEGSIAYAVEQLRASIQTQIDELAGKVNKNAEDIAELQKQIGLLQQRIQSLVFVPQYTDLKFGIPFSKIGDTYKAFNPDGGFAVVYKVAPAHLAKPLADAVNEAIEKGVASVFTFDIESGLQTRATATEPKLLFKGASGDEETGKMTFYLEHSNFDPTSGNLNKYAISLRADNDDYKVHVASEFVQAALHKISTIEVDYDNIYKPNVTTGEVDPTSVIAKNELKNLDIEYTDGESHVSIFDGYEMAATADGKKRTFSQFKAMGYDMPEVKVNVSKYEGTCASIEANIDGSASTFSVKIKDGDNDNMKVTKTQINENNKYSFGFTDGVNTVTANLQVTIQKHTGAFQIKVPYTMTWTYGSVHDDFADAKVDNANKDKADPTTWVEAYKRGTGCHYTDEESFVVKPTLTVGSEDLELDGSNKVYGLTVEDFMGKAFTTSWDPTSEGVTFNFNVVKVDATAGKNTLSLAQFDLAKARMGKTYACTGTYELDAYSTEGVTAAVTITTVDRKTDVIKITAPAKEGVKILGDEYDETNKAYNITSDDFADALLTAYIAQGILPEGTTKSWAFSTNTEFGTTIKTVDDTASELDDKFTYYVDYYSPNEAFKIKSKDGELKSAYLHQIASGSDCEEKEWALTIETFVGQKVQITWPISVVPKYDYRFVTTGSDTFAVETEWVGGPSAITKAKTELDLVKANDNIKVMYNDGTTDKYVEYTHYGDAGVKLVPWFSLVKDYTGVKMEDTGSAALPCLSNVKYYGPATSVGVKSALYVMSDDTKFYVPGSDKMYVSGTPVTSVTIMQDNPIAAVQVDPTQTTNITDGGAASLVYITMKDAKSYSLYANGKSQADQFPYKDGGKTIKEIFNSIFFSVYSVNGNTSTTGWALEGAVEGKVDTPNEIRLKTNGVAAGSYNVVIKAQTVWKTYEYKANVIVQ